MKNNLILQLALLTLALVSCGTDSRHFKIDGRLLHLDQGEFYVYRPDGGVVGLDTIKVKAGRFSYEVECDRPTTLLIVFPNFTEQPVFAQPGKKVELRGDASHLKEMTVKGTRDNELMNTFREQILSASPPETVKYACQFVEDHPKSVVGVWLVNKYLVHTAQPDYATATRLVDVMMAAQPDNGYLKRMRQQLTKAPTLTVGAVVPRFKATAIDSTALTNAALTAAPTVAVVAWASWKYDSTNLLRRLYAVARESEGQSAVIGICADASPLECRKSMNSQTIDCRVVCDGLMMDSPLLRTFGLTDIPDNVLIKDGRVVAMHLTTDELIERLRKK